MEDQYENPQQVLQAMGNGIASRAVLASANDARKHYEGAGDTMVPPKDEDLVKQYFARTGHKTYAEREAAKKSKITD